MRNLSVKFPITRSGRDRSSSITHTFHIPCNYWCLTCPVPTLPTTNECKNPNWQVQTCRNSISSQNDHLSIKEIQNSIFILRTVSLYTHKISKLLSLGLFINVYPTNYPSPWQDLRPPAWWQPRAAHSAQPPLTRLGGQPEPFRDWAEEATYQSSMKWKRFWSLELFFAFVRATAVQLSGIVPSLSMENVITVEMQRSQFCFNSNSRNSWYGI